MLEKLRTLRISWGIVISLAAGLIIFAALLCMGSDNGRRDLEARQKKMRDLELELQEQRSDKEQELNRAESNEYLTQKAKEYGYLMPGEIRFVVTNLDELLENGGDAETEIAEEGL